MGGEYADYYKRNRANTIEKGDLYKNRQAIVEHPYGTIKRQWGFSYILTKKGMKRASSIGGFMIIEYNLRRIGNILTREVLKEYVRILVLSILRIFGLQKRILMTFEDLFFPKVEQETKKWAVA
jgi:hypothetical protein